MDLRNGNPLHILVVAILSERRDRLAALTGRAGHVRVTGSERISSEPADVLLIDVDGPGLANAVIRTAAELPQGTGVIALADDPHPQWVRAALRAGVNAILTRELTAEELQLAILAAEAGLVLLHPTSAQNLGRQGLPPVPDAPALVEALTAREQEVLRLVSEGLGNKEIAARLNISDHTVKFHISSVLGKLGASSRTEAVSRGIRRGLLAI